MYQDLTGRRFGRLLLLNPFYFEKKRMYWECLCDCGNIKIANENSMKKGSTKSCGCLKKEMLRDTYFIDITGQKFGRLLVIEYSCTKNKKLYWLCKCDCGLEKIVESGHLKSGHTRSCGCYSKESLKKRLGGKNHFNWRGGISEQKYPSEWTNELKIIIRNRDNHKCKYPDCTYDDTKETKKLHVHHIDGNKANCQEYNLISLCNSHHITIENDHPELWEYYFYQITEDFYRN